MDELQATRVDHRPAIEVRGLARHFGERPALTDVTISVGTGQTLAVLGRNGAGKSTLLRILATLLRPHGGEVRILGEQLPRWAHAVRPKLGYLGHEPLLYRDLTGRQNLLYHARLHRVAPARVDELLEIVKMRPRAEEPIGSLSRGLIQRLAVCRAVLHEPRVLLLDEPRANLDPRATELVEPLIGRGTGPTRVITSHDPQAAIEEADVVLALRDGRVAFAGEPGRLERQKLQELYR